MEFSLKDPPLFFTALSPKYKIWIFDLDSGSVAFQVTGALRCLKEKKFIPRRHGDTEEKLKGKTLKYGFCFLCVFSVLPCLRGECF